MPNSNNLTIRNYYIFGVVMQDPVLCREFLETLLQSPVGELSVLESEHDIKITPDGKAIRLDIYAEESVTGKIYDSEMQNLNKKSIESLYLPKRSRFYQSLIDLNQLGKMKSRNYRLLNDTDIVFICTFDPFGYGEYRYVFENTCEDVPALKLKSGSRIIFYNTTSKKENVPEEIKKLYNYINTGKVSGELTEKMDEAVTTACMNSEIVEVAMRSEVWYMDAENVGYDRGFKEGRISDLAQMLARGGSEEQLKQFLDATDEEISLAKEEVAKIPSK